MLLRSYEQTPCTSDISLYNKDQNIDFRTTMLEKEEQKWINRMKEIEEGIDYFAPYLTRMEKLGNFSYKEVLDVKYACLGYFKNLFLQRTIRLQEFLKKVRLLIELKFY